MAAKQTKLQNQAQAFLNDAKVVGTNANNNSSVSQVFHGCVIYINGYTGAAYSSEMLQRLIVAHGGIHVNHMWGGQTTVTHIIATTLTNRKREMLQDYRVVTPAWILACIEQKKLLDWIQYRTFPGKDPAQRVLAFTSVAPDNPVVANTLAPQHVDLEKEGKEEKEKKNTTLPENKKELSALGKEIASEAVGDFLNKEDRYSKSVPPITDPAFITYFYQNSRLHHLSHWKAELRRRYFPPAIVVAQLLASTPPSSAVAESARPPILFHVDYDSFFVSASLLTRPELRDRPVVVASGSAQSSDVASANYVARQQYGVRNGMWLASARQRCPALVVLPLEFTVYEQKSAALYDVLNTLGADLVYPVSVDEAVIDVSSVVYSQVEERDVSLKEAVAALAATIRNKVREAAGIEVSVGAGTNMLLARLALAQAKPAGSHFLSSLVTPTNEHNPNTKDDKAADTSSSVDDTLTLRDLPGVGRSIVQRLAAMGITSLRQLRAPHALAQLTNEFGPNHGMRLHELGHGIDRTRLVDCCARDRKSVGAEISWGVRANSRNDVDVFLGNLLQEVCRRLNDENDSNNSSSSYTSETMQNHGFNDSSSASSTCSLNKVTTTMARGVTLKVYRALPDADITRAKRLGHGQCDVYSRSRTLGAATCDPAVLLRVLRTLMDGMDCPPARLRGVGIQLTKLERVAASAGIVGTVRNKGSMLRFVTSAATAKKAADTTVDLADNAATAINTDNPSAADSTITTNSAITASMVNPNGEVIESSNERTANNFGNIKHGGHDKTEKILDLDRTDVILIPHIPDATNIDWNVYNTLPASLKRFVRAEYNLPAATASQLLREEAEVEAEADSNLVLRLDQFDKKSKFNCDNEMAMLMEEETLLREEYELEAQTKQIEIERQIHIQRLQPENPKRQQQQQLNQKEKKLMLALPAKRARLTRRPRVYQNTLTQQFSTELDNSSNENSGEAEYNYFRHPSILDADVLRELPASVLAEIQHDLKLRGVASISNSTSNNGINKVITNQGPTTTKSSNGSTHTRAQPPARNPPLLDARHAPADASRLVAQWLTFATEAGGGPHDADVRVVTDYACRLAANPRYWGDAVGFFQSVKREISMYACGVWDPFLADLQEAIQATFESQGVPVIL